MPEFVNELATNGNNQLKARRMGIDTQQEFVAYMTSECTVCRSEGFTAQTRVRLRSERETIIAKLNVVSSNSHLLDQGCVGLSDSAWKALKIETDDLVKLEHPDYLTSLSHVRSKIFNNELDEGAFREIVGDIVAGRYSDVHLASFLTACAGQRLSTREIVHLTRAMVRAGDRLSWPHHPLVLDKHCVGGLPGNRTTPIVVAIVAAAGLVMPKTSSRAITSPAGTADTMEVLTEVNLSIEAMRRTVDQCGACLAWGGGSIALSPADDIMIRIERALNLDGEGQLIASVLSKKISAGATHCLIDMPVGPTAKVRNQSQARQLSDQFIAVGEALGLQAAPVITDGRQPVGWGIGPAHEALDVLQVLRNEPEAAEDLKERSLQLAGQLLEMAGRETVTHGYKAARELLESGVAWEKFEQICQAQGGLKPIPEAPYAEVVTSYMSGIVSAIDNRKLAQIAKLAGAPQVQSAGIRLAAKLGSEVDEGKPLMTLYAGSVGELHYALNYYRRIGDVFTIEE